MSHTDRSLTSEPFADEEQDISSLESASLHQRILDLEQQVQRLQQRETLYHLALQHCPTSSVLLFDHSLHVLLVAGTPFPPDMLAHEQTDNIALQKLLAPDVYAWLEPLAHAVLAGTSTTHTVECGPQSYALHVLPLRADDSAVMAGMLVLQDVTAERQTEAVLQMQERALGAVKNGILITDADQHDMPIIYCNPGFERLTGYTAEEILGRNCRFLQGPDSDPATIDEIRGAVQAGQPSQVVIKNYRKDGTPFWNELSISPVHNAQDRITHFIGIQADVTDRVRAEDALRESEARYRAVAEMTSDYVYGMNILSDGSTASEWITDAFTSITGYTIDEIKARGGLLSMVHPDDLDSVQERINILFSGQPDERAYRIVTHSGEIRWLRDSACAERNSQQRSVYILGAAQDITEQKLAEDAINESRARLQAMFDNATVGVVLVNPGGRFIEVNERWATMLGCTHETIYQKTYLDITHPDDIAASLDYMHALVNQEKENFHMEKRYVRLDGSIFWGDVSVRVVRNDQGQLEGLIGVVVDITERKQVENALRLSEQKFRSFVEQSTYGISLCNAEGVIIEWNRAQEQITGIMREEALGCALWDIQFALGLEERRTPAAYANLQTLAKEFFRTGQAAWVNQIIEIEIQRPDDTRCMLQTLTFPVQTEHGFMAGTIATDVTEHVQLKQSLHAREEQFRTLVDSMDDIVFMLDREQRHIGVFGHWLERYGLKTEDFLGKTARQTSPDEATALIHEAANERALKGEYVVYEWSIGHPPVYIQTSLSPIRADNGEITGLVGVGRDITALREVQTALQESNYRIRNVLESITDAFFALDQQYRFTYLNQHAAHLLQRQRDDLLGKCVWDEFPEAAETIFFSEYQRVMEQRVPARFEAFYMPFDAWFDVHAYPLDGGLSVYFQDITARKHTEEALQQANHDLTRWVSALEQRAREITLLNDMGDLLQTCRTEEEAYIVVSQIMTRLFPNESGTLYILSPSRTLAEGMAHWGSLTLPQTLVPDDCWALRRGHMHVSQQTSVGLVCQHLQTPLPACALCVPMMAQSEMLGIFHLCREQGVFSEATKQLAITVAEHIALALATLRLQETLRHQAIRDSLTGLYNRRYMEESLEREMGRAIRRSSSLGVIMLDLDHFKRFNDTYGHAAGDAVLRELGAFLKSHIRSEDIACRYGGEEFALIILDADLHSVRRIAEHMCASVHHLNVWSHGQSLGRVTLSLGAAIFPEDGTTADEVIRAADAALYQAKAQGRDRVVLSQDIACT